MQRLHQRRRRPDHRTEEREDQHSRRAPGSQRRQEDGHLRRVQVLNRPDRTAAHTAKNQARDTQWRAERQDNMEAVPKRRYDTGHRVSVPNSQRRNRPLRQRHDHLLRAHALKHDQRASEGQDPPDRTTSPLQLLLPDNQRDDRREDIQHAHQGQGLRERSAPGLCEAPERNETMK